MACAVFIWARKSRGRDRAAVRLNPAHEPGVHVNNHVYLEPVSQPAPRTWHPNASVNSQTVYSNADVIREHGMTAGAAYTTSVILNTGGQRCELSGAGPSDYEEPVPFNPAYAELDPNAVNLDPENCVSSPSLTATRCAYRRNGRSNEQCKANVTNCRPWCAAHTCTGCGDASKPSTKSFCDGCATNANLDAENYVVSPPPTTTSAYARPGELTLHDEYDEHNRTARA